MTSVPLSDLDNFRVGFGTVKALMEDMIGIFDPQDNDIQWQTWTPTISAASPMTVNTFTINTAQYVQIGRYCFFNVDIDVELAGTASAEVRFTLPLTRAGSNTAIRIPMLMGDNGVSRIGHATGVSGNAVACFKNDISSWTLSVTNSIQGGGSFRVAV